MNSRGHGEEVMFFVLFFLMVLMGVSISLGVLFFFSHKIDLRESDASLLNSRIRQCVFDYDVFDSSFNLSLCDLNADAISSSYYVNIEPSHGQSLTWGISDFKNQCYFRGLDARKDKPYCSSSTVSVRGETYTITVGTKTLTRGTL